MIVQMVKKLSLEEVIVELHKLSISEVKEQELMLSADLNKTLVVYGLIRTGKTYLLYQMALELMKKNLPIERLFYINFRDERLYG